MMRWLQVLLSLLLLTAGASTASASTRGKPWRGFGLQKQKDKENDTKDGTSPDGKKEESKGRRWSWRPPSKNQKPDSDGKKTKPTKQPQEPPKPTSTSRDPSKSQKGGKLFPQFGLKKAKPSSSKTTKAQKEADKEQVKEETVQDVASPKNNATDTQTQSQNETETNQAVTPAEKDSASTSTTNATGTSETNTTKSVPPQQKGNGMPANSPQQQQRAIILGGTPSGPPRHHPLLHRAQQQQQQEMKQLQDQMRKDATTMAAVELAARILSGALRFWLLLWASRHVATRQETIHPTQHFVFERLNDKYIRDTRALQTAMDAPPLGVSKTRWKQQLFQRQGPSRLFKLFHRPRLSEVFAKTVLVLDVGDGRGNVDWDHLTDVVSFLIMQHRSQAFGSKRRKVMQVNGQSQTVMEPVELEVVLRVDSPGGSVAPYGLAASQILRLRREEGIITTVCVDKSAASGGYMIASQADKIYAAPFASVGSIGVFMQALNYHGLLKQHGIQPLVLKAGEAKNPLTEWGEVTKEGLKMKQEDLARTHDAFQKFTVRGRPQLAGMKPHVCDGSVYMGDDALSRKLIDGIVTSDEYLMDRIEAGDRVLKLHRSHQSRRSPHLRLPTPMDIIPHLRSWIENRAISMDISQMPGKAIQMAIILSFANHLMGKTRGE